MQTHLSVNHLCSADRMANYIELKQYTRNKSEHSVVIHLFPDIERFPVILLNFYLIEDNLIRM